MVTCARLCAAPTVVAVRIGLWLLPGPLVRAVVNRAARARPPAAAAPVDPTPIADAVARASRWVPRASCLVQALATQVLLVSAGSPGTIMLGATRGGPRGLWAHAWVEHSGRVVIGEGPLGHVVLGPLRGTP